MDIKIKPCVFHVLSLYLYQHACLLLHIKIMKSNSQFNRVNSLRFSNALNKQTRSPPPFSQQCSLDHVLIYQIHYRDCFTETASCGMLQLLLRSQCCTLQQYYTLAPWGKTVIDTQYNLFLPDVWTAILKSECTPRLLEILRHIPDIK